MMDRHFVAPEEAIPQATAFCFSLHPIKTLRTALELIAGGFKNNYNRRKRLQQAHFLSCKNSLRSTALQQWCASGGW